MQEEQSSDRRGRSSAGLLIAFATGMGAAAAAILLAKRLKEAKGSLSLDAILKGCDEAASQLDNRIRLAG